MKLWEGMAAPLLHWLSLNFIYLLEKNLKKNSTLSLHDVDEGRSMEYLLTLLQDEIKSSSNEIVLRKQNLLAAISEYVFWKEFHCLLPSLLVCWKNFFFYEGFLHRNWRFAGQQGKRGDSFLFQSTTSTRWRTLRHLFATLHVRWLSRTFNCNACVYQTATRWDLAPYRITIWVIDWQCNVWWIDTKLLL